MSDYLVPCRSFKPHRHSPVIEIGDFRICSDPIQWGVRDIHQGEEDRESTGSALSVFLRPAMNNQALIDAAFHSGKRENWIGRL